MVLTPNNEFGRRYNNDFKQNATAKLRPVLIKGAKTMAGKRIELHVSSGSGGVAYVTLPDHPGKGTPSVAKKQVSLKDIYPNYKGPDLYFDFDKDDRLIGIEILAV